MTEYYLNELSWTSFLYKLVKKKDKWKAYLVAFRKGHTWELYSNARFCEATWCNETKRKNIKKYKWVEVTKEEVFLILL